MSFLPLQSSTFLRDIHVFFPFILITPSLVSFDAEIAIITFSSLPSIIFTVLASASSSDFIRHWNHHILTQTRAPLTLLSPYSITSFLPWYIICLSQYKPARRLHVSTLVLISVSSRRTSFILSGLHRRLAKSCKIQTVIFTVIGVILHQCASRFESTTLVMRSQLFIALHLSRIFKHLTFCRPE